MNQTNSKICSCANTNISLPIYEISSLSILPPELRNLVFNFLGSETCNNHTLTLAYLSKAHYAAFIPRLYRRINITDEIIERGVFEGLLRGPHQWETQLGELPLPSKSDLLMTCCQSLVLESLCAWYAITDAIQAWDLALGDRWCQITMGEERRYSGLFTNLAHLAFEADCIEGICRKRSLPPLGQRATLYLWNLFAVCFRLPDHISEEVLGNISNIIHYYQGFGPNPATCVTRVQNVKSTPRMAGVDVLHLLSCSDTMFVDLLPIDFDPGVTTVVHHADDIVQFCVNFMSQWPLPESHRKMAPYPRNIIFTGMDTVHFPDGLIHCLSPSIKQSVLDTVEKSIRQRVRVGLQDRAPQSVGMEDMIQVRGYEECEFCPKASREVEQGEWLLPMQDAAEIAEDKQEKACPQKEYDDGETWQIAV